METEDFTLEDKCENLMSVVVESRKKFGKMCVDYDQKISLMENKILDLQLETISNHRFKTKNTATTTVQDTDNDADDFIVKILENQKRLEELRQKVRDTESVVLQLKGDTVGPLARYPLTAETMFRLAKEKSKKK